MSKPRSQSSDEKLYERIRSLIAVARHTISRGVNLVQVQVNFEIGRHIVEHEQSGEKRAVYGDELLDLLANKLTTEFGRGFARSNIAYMRSFYLVFQDRAAIVQSASGQLHAVEVDAQS